jgi:hypothetical protein
MQLTRRQFAKAVTAASLAAAYVPKGFSMDSRGIRLGLNTFSLRALPHDTAIPTILQVMKAEKLRDCQLLAAHAEPAQFSPTYPVTSANGPRVAPTPPTPQQLEERKAAAAARSEWRASVPMSYFENIRSTFEKEQLRITAYATTFGTSEAEIDRVFQMSKELGVETVNGRVPEAITDLVAAAATKYQLRVGIQVSDVKLLEQQLRTSPYLRADPDIGDLTRTRVNALQFVQDHASDIVCIDLKDTVGGGGSVPFGEGEAQLAQVLQLLDKQKLPITAYIDCDYPGTGKSPEEVARCVSFVRGVVATA